MEDKRMNLDVLAGALKRVDAGKYDHSLLTSVLRHLYAIDSAEQKMIMKTALLSDMSFNELMEHIRSQFIVLQQEDAEGQYCGLGFGEECVSVATWKTWDTPDHADMVKTTKLCYKDHDGKKRCDQFLDFAEFWMELNEASFGEFLSGIPTLREEEE